MTIANAARPTPTASGRGIGSLGVSSVRPRPGGRAAAPRSAIVAGGGDAVVTSRWLTSSAGLLDERGVDRGVRIGDGLRLADRLPELPGLLEDVVDRSRRVLGPVVLPGLRDAPDRDGLHRRLDLVGRLAEVVGDIGEGLVGVGVQEVDGRLVALDERADGVRMLLDEARRERDLVG